MNDSSTFHPTTETQLQLHMANSQLALYARDLKRIVDAERRKSWELAEANARLQILDRLKTDFLCFISHELRTPLVALSAVEMFDPHNDPELLASAFAIFRDGYERLHQFIMKGLTYFARLAEEEARVAQDVDLSALLGRVVGALPGLAEPGTEVQLATPDQLCLVRGREDDLTVVLEILVDNAAKFSPQDKVIRLEVQPAAHSFILAVTDNGAGFPPEMAPELFRPFTVGDILHHSRGSGLSLALAFLIVESYGGRIWAESEGIGKGATFRVELAASHSGGGSDQ